MWVRPVTTLRRPDSGSRRQAVKKATRPPDRDHRPRGDPAIPCHNPPMTDPSNAPLSAALLLRVHRRSPRAAGTPRRPRASPSARHRRADAPAPTERRLRPLASAAPLRQPAMPTRSTTRSRPRSSQIRGLEATKKVARETIDEDQLRERLTEAVRQGQRRPTTSPPTSGCTRRSASCPPDADLRELSPRPAERPAGVAGFYDDDEKKMYVVSRSGDIGANEKITYAHEYTTRSRTSTSRSSASSRTSSTRATGRSRRTGVYEGDATLLMTLWALQHLTPPSWPRSRSVLDPEQQAVLDKMPKILQRHAPVPVLDGRAVRPAGADGAAAGRRSTRSTTGCPSRPSRSSTRRSTRPTRSRSTSSSRPTSRSSSATAGPCRSRTRSASSRSATWLRVGGVADADAPPRRRPAGAATASRSSTARAARGPSSCRRSGTPRPMPPSSRRRRRPRSRRRAASRRSCPERAARRAGSSSARDDATLSKVAGVLGLAG